MNVLEKNNKIERILMEEGVFEVEVGKFCRFIDNTILESGILFYCASEETRGIFVGIMKKDGDFFFVVSDETEENCSYYPKKSAMNLYFQFRDTSHFSKWLKKNNERVREYEETQRSLKREVSPQPKKRKSEEIEKLKKKLKKEKEFPPRGTTHIIFTHDEDVDASYWTFDESSTDEDLIEILKGYDENAYQEILDYWTIRSKEDKQEEGEQEEEYKKVKKVGKWDFFSGFPFRNNGVLIKDITIIEFRGWDD